MSETGIQFGVTTETKSTNQVGYDKGGFKKAILTSVKFEEVGKDDKKYKTLSFTFQDVEGIKTFKHSEFAIEADDTDFAKKLNGMNSRIKHIYEAFQPLTKSIGENAKSFEDFFNQVALVFNEDGKDKTPIYKLDNKSSILVWIKLAYYSKKGNIGFPLSPNFIEKVTQNNQTEPKTLAIDNRWDKVDQPRSTQPSGNTMGTTGIHTGTVANSGDEF